MLVPRYFVNQMVEFGVGHVLGTSRDGQRFDTPVENNGCLWYNVSSVVYSEVHMPVDEALMFRHPLQRFIDRVEVPEECYNSVVLSLKARRTKC